MITIISPAKTLDWNESLIDTYTKPDFEKEVKELVSIMKKKKTKDIKTLMNLSDNLAQLNHDRYQYFDDDSSVENAKQALLAFKGDVYTRIDVENFSEDDFEYAQRHLRILSGLYGLLKPLDLIQPYRLEMGTRLKNKKGKDLYGFWGTKIAEALDAASDDGVVVNLASQEYFKAVDQKKLKAEVISPVFKEYRDGTYKIIGIFAKQARGLMTDFIIKNRINDPDKLKIFQAEGYEYCEKLSKEKEWVFIR